MSDAKPEIWFYHLERSTLDQVLPTLLERTLQRGWRALIRGATSHRLDDIDELLWTYRDNSFLPHGRADGDHAARQPVLLSESGENLNGAQALFIVDDSELGATQEFARCFIIFDGRDEQALNHARGRWRTLKADGADLAYWKQSEEGRWEKAA
ncbi:DNA polymerase III subunit chi [Brevundimonas naejangsanensis]|uniref:DNA polymerase III subunit chi n=1 Tax=Brevundimonas naejangsanensis TaxID=588932 RepID=UPI00040F26FD|nr:DNA polymerase III subunit chi [Brevundimonas naejangsanensis]